jgi:hypothetical protein
MIPGQYDLQLYRGDTFKWTVKLWKDAKQTDPTNLTGATVKAEYRDKTGGTPVVSITTALTLPNTIDLTFPAAAWATAPLAGIWDLQVTMPDASVNTVLRGNVQVIGDVTDSV